MKNIIIFSLLGVTAFLIGFGLFRWSYSDAQRPPGNLPSDVGTEDILYKTCEPTGAFGRAQYWFITNDGHRYIVSQGLYDTMTEIPTEIGGK